MVYTWAQERQLKFDEYRDLSSRLLMWLRENTAVMLDRNFPSTLIEMKVRIVVTGGVDDVGSGCVCGWAGIDVNVKQCEYQFSEMKQMVMYMTKCVAMCVVCCVCVCVCVRARACVRKCKLKCLCHTYFFTWSWSCRLALLLWAGYCAKSAPENLIETDPKTRKKRKHFLKRNWHCDLFENRHHS